MEGFHELGIPMFKWNTTGHLKSNPNNNVLQMSVNIRDSQPKLRGAFKKIQDFFVQKL